MKLKTKGASKASSKISDIVKLIKSKKSFVLTTHVNPDGDGLGAQSALYSALRKLGKKVTIVNHDPLPKHYKFLPFAAGYQVSDIIPAHEVCFVLDAGDFSRIREGVKREEFSILVNIDHHFSNDYYGDYNLVDPKAAATGEVVYDLIKALKVKIDKGIAESVYTSIVTDTGGFRHSNTTPSVLRLAAELMESGADGARVNEKIFSGISKEAMELMRLSLGQIQLHNDGQIGTMTLSGSDLLKSGAEDEDTENLINYVRKIETVKIAVFLKERPDRQIKLSLRSSQTNINVASIAARFGGGGHAYAAGAVMPGPLSQALEEVLKVCKTFLK